MEDSQRRRVSALRAVAWGLSLSGLSALALFQLAGVLQEADFVDFSNSYGASAALFAGRDPYAPENFPRFFETSIAAYFPDHRAPPVFPGHAPLFAPFLLADLEVSQYLFFVLSLILGAATGILLVQRAIGPVRSHLGWAALVVLVSLSSSPGLYALSVGQTSLVRGFLVLWLLAGARLPLKGVGLSIVVGLKYTAAPFGLLLLAKRRFLTCALAFVLFVAWATAPAWLGHDLVEVYGRYRSHIEEHLADGFFTYRGHGGDLLQLEFFREPALNWAGKAILGAILLAALWREIWRPALSLNAVLLVTSATLCLVYHRLYDAVLLVPLLLVAARALWLRRRWGLAAIAIGFLAFFALPQGWVAEAANVLGEWVREDSWILVSPCHCDAELFTLFPLCGVVMLLCCAFTAVLNFFGEEIPLVNRVE
jgi:hypothetical protein